MWWLFFLHIQKLYNCITSNTYTQNIRFSHYDWPRIPLGCFIWRSINRFFTHINQNTISKNMKYEKNQVAAVIVRYFITFTCMHFSNIVQRINRPTAPLMQFNVSWKWSHIYYPPLFVCSIAAFVRVRVRCRLLLCK